MLLLVLSSPLLSGICPILLCPVILCSFSTNRTSSFEHATSVRLLSSIARKSVTVIPLFIVCWTQFVLLSITILSCCVKSSIDSLTLTRLVYFLFFEA